METEELKFSIAEDRMKGLYNKDNSNSQNLNLKEYDEYCDNQGLNQEEKKFPEKDNKSENGKNQFENEDSYDINNKTTVERTTVGNNNQENDFNKKEIDIPANFEDIIKQQPLQQESNLGINAIGNIESNNSLRQTQAINASSSFKATKEKIFKIIKIPKKKENIERNIIKKEISSHLSKSNVIFKTEIENKFFDDYMGLTYMLKLDSLILESNCKRLGRLSIYHKNLGIKGKHNNKSSDNLYLKIIHSCNNSITKEINDELKLYNFSLQYLPIKKSLKSGFVNYDNFCQKDLYYIYIHSFPRNNNSSEKLKIQQNREENIINENIEAIIKNAITQEKRKNKEKIRKLNLLFKTTFYVILNAFLNDRDFIEVDNTKIILKKFETYKDCLKELTVEEKEKFRKNLIKNLEKYGNYKFI